MNRTNLFLVAVFAGVLAIIVGPTLKHEIYVEPYSPRVFVAESKWWGPGLAFRNPLDETIRA